MIRLNGYRKCTLVTVGGWDCKGIFNASRTFRPERGRFRGCITCEKIAAFHISDEMLEAISEKSSRKKVTAKLPEQQKSLYFIFSDFVHFLAHEHGAPPQMEYI